MTETLDDPFGEWSARIRAGEKDALGELFRHVYPSLVRYARQFTGSESQAEDVVQETFLHLWNRRERLDPQGSLRALLYTAVRNRALNQRRDATHRDQLLDTMERDADPAPAPDAATDASLLGDRLRAWIGEMPERRREAFELSRYDGLSYKEIARVMDVSVRTVEQHVRLALAYLRDHLREFEPDRLNS